jgi:hypothetical protein
MEMDGKRLYRQVKHNERCPKCKERVREFLERIYGDVQTNYRFYLGTRPMDFKNTPYYGKLLEIYRALQNYRGYKEFVKAKNIPRSDFFIPDPGFIVEFDESQHFTIPRKITLELYPEIEWVTIRLSGSCCVRRSTPKITIQFTGTSSVHGMIR